MNDLGKTYEIKLRTAARYIIEADKEKPKYNEHRNEILMFVQDCLEFELKTDYYSNPKNRHIAIEPLISFKILDDNSVEVRYREKMDFELKTKVFHFGEKAKPELQATFNPDVYSFISFNDFKDYVRINSLPPHWHCEYKGYDVTHLNADSYRLAKEDIAIFFTSDEILLTGKTGELFTVTKEYFHNSYVVNNSK